MWYNIAGEIMEYAPNCRYCEVVLNGEYQGIYLLAETITAGEGCRLNLRMNIKNAQASGYLIRCDRPVEEDLETLRDIHVYSERTNENKHDFAIRYPGKNILTPELAKDIELDYSAFANGVDGSTLKNTLALDANGAAAVYDELTGAIDGNTLENTLTLDTGGAATAYNNFVGGVDGTQITIGVQADTTQTVSAFDAIAAKASEIQGPGHLRG